MARKISRSLRRLISTFPSQAKRESTEVSRSRRFSFAVFKALSKKDDLILSPTDPERKSFRASLDASSLHFKDLPLKLGKLIGGFELPEKKGDPIHYDFDTSLGLEATELSSLAHNFCVSNDHIPPAQLIADFPTINLTPGTIDPSGSFKVQLFKGTIELSEIGLYDLDTKVPEVDFDLDIDGVRLDQLGDWAGFGEMDGSLQAHAHDVVFQGWLPTQYDFKFEAKPLNKRKSIFSPKR